MEINFETERKSLEAKISDLESRMAPIQKELKESRERLSHIIALMPTKEIKPVFPGLEWGFWRELCNKNNWRVGGDSAHRVVRRKDPQLHNSIPHQCEYDGRRYP